MNNGYANIREVHASIAQWAAKYDAENTAVLHSMVDSLPTRFDALFTQNEAENIAEMIELTFYRHIKDMYKIGEMDNLEWAETVLSGWRKLQKIAEQEEQE